MTGILMLLIRGMLALTLYIFLCWALIIIWRDLRERRISIEIQQPPVIRLEIQNGDLVQHRIFQGTEITMGRDPACECILQSETVSAYHARFSHHHGQWWLEDLKSTNSTFINDAIVRTATVVIPGDQIRCGDIKITILEE